MFTLGEPDRLMDELRRGRHHPLEDRSSVAWRRIGAVFLENLVARPSAIFRAPSVRMGYPPGPE
jgi:hypothetical protein